MEGQRRSGTFWAGIRLLEEFGIGIGKLRCGCQHGSRIASAIMRQSRIQPYLVPLLLVLDCCPGCWWHTYATQKSAAYGGCL